MAIGDTKGTNTGLRGFNAQSMTVTGLSNNTAYTVEVTFPTGRVQNLAVTSDGSGNAIIPPIPAWEPGTHTLVVKTVPAVAYTTTWKA